MSLSIDPLGAAPELVGIIAERCWGAWWQDSDVTLQAYRAGVEEMAHRDDRVPFARVAHDQGRYRGSVFVIENDLTARPHFSPWIAAVWVEPAHRRQGIATRLLREASDAAARQGHAACYLCASPANTPFYRARGAQQIEADVDGLNVLRIALIPPE